MRNFLSKLLSENSRSYSCFLSWVSETAVSTIWGIGVMPAYSVKPYACELQGSKPGRFLKMQSTPHVNRQCYFLDGSGNFIEELRYAKHLPRRNKWIVYRTFYQYEGDSVIEYSFDSEMDDSLDASLNYVSITKFSAGDAISSHTLYAKGTYIEENYERIGSAKTHITQKIWGEIYIVREYEVTGVDKDLSIFEVTNQGLIRIYP